MLLRERAREYESEGEGDGDEGDNQTEKRRKRQGKSFGVESKVFEVELEKRRGKTLLFIVESKRGVFSWVRLGPASAGIFLEGLDQCVKDGKDDKWEKGWKEKGRSYSMVREVNKAGSFIRLGVVDAEEKRYNICIPRGRGGREGWSVMAEVVWNLTTMIDRREEKKEEPTLERRKVEMGKRWGNEDSLSVIMEIEREQICRNVDRLGQCLVGKWNPRVAGGEDLARMGWLMASVWGMKGKLGLAWMEEGQALLDFEHAVEASEVFVVGKRSMGRIHVYLELWSPSLGCLEEGEIKEEVWVRIKGLPLSLWVPNILRRVGDECGGFVAMDTSTEKMENILWARILVKTKRGELPSSVEIGIEGTVYNLPLWWEVLPSIRQKSEGRRGSTDRGRGEDRGDGGARAGRRVEEWGSAGFEALLRSDDGMEGQLDRMGRVSAVG